MMDWLNGLISNSAFPFLGYLTGYVLIVAFACITISFFCSIFSAIFRR